MAISIAKNVVQMFPTQIGEISNPLPELEILGFNVASAEAEFHTPETGHLPTPYQINYREDNCTPLGVCKGQYKIIQNSELYDLAGKALQESAPTRALSSAKVTEKSSNDGARCFIDISFPELTQDLQQLKGNSTGLMFRILGWNSFDGSSPVRFSSGAIDAYCSNGMLWGDYSIFGARHTQGFDSRNLEKFFALSFSDFQQKIVNLREEAQKSLELEKAQEFLEKKFSKALAKKLLERFEVEAFERGQSVWALRSALTYYASHDSSNFSIRNTGNDHSASTLYTREEEVRKVVNSSEFKNLALAA